MRIVHHLGRLFVVFALLVSLGRSADPDRVAVTVMATTDLHGRIRPLDYYTQKPSNVGLAKLATLIKGIRQREPEALLVDCGDTIQGTPLVYFHNRRNNTPADPMMLVMNALHYTSMTLGNHEYNFGLPVLEKARREATFPWLSANTYRVGTNDTAYPPYVVREVKGVRVGILGMTTPAIPHWENPEHYRGLEFRETVGEAQKWVKVLREKEQVDVVVVTVHMGTEYDLRDGTTDPGDFKDENASLALARNVPGIDAIFMGHTHREIPSLVVNGVLLAQAGRWGDHLIRADFYLQRGSAGGWSVIGKTSRSLAVTDQVAPDPEVIALSEPYHAETEKWLSQPIGTSELALDAADATFQDSAVLDFIHRVQMEVGGADVSVVPNFNVNARIPQGTVTVRDVAALYLYENTLYVVEVTGAQLRAALEHAARYFLAYEEGKSPAELVNKLIPRYNFDIAEGVEYEIALREPAGQRIKNLKYKGEPLRDDQTLKVAMSNYRYNGGGNYTMYKDAKVVFRSKEEIRDMLIRWAEEHGSIPSQPSGNWRLVW